MRRINLTIILFQIKITDSGWCNSSGAAAGTAKGGGGYSSIRISDGLKHPTIKKYFPANTTAAAAVTACILSTEMESLSDRLAPIQTRLAD